MTWKQQVIIRILLLIAGMFTEPAEAELSKALKDLHSHISAGAWRDGQRATPAPTPEQPDPKPERIGLPGILKESGNGAVHQAEDTATARYRASREVPHA
jgi:hypothetical protein